MPMGLKKDIVMNSKILNYILIAVTVLLSLGLIFSADAANSILKSRSKELLAAKNNNLTTVQQQMQLAMDKKTIAKYSELNSIAETVVPQDKDQAEAVREIVNLAGASGISQLSSISFPPSVLGGTSIKSSSGLTQVTPVPGVPGVYALQITISQSPNSPVPYSSLTSFLTKLEQNRRTAQVSSISIEPDSKTPNNVSFTLVINEFIKP